MSKEKASGEEEPFTATDLYWSGSSALQLPLSGSDRAGNLWKQSSSFLEQSSWSFLGTYLLFNGITVFLQLLQKELSYFTNKII